MRYVIQLLAWVVAGAISLSATAGEPVVKVMSFNIRYGLAKDGDNEWSKRSDLVLETITSFEPDLLGTQETLKFQAEFLKTQLPSHYGYVGKTRDANPKGEQCALFYRKDRFDLIATHQFWLSETPDVPVSKSWDSSLPRIVTLAVLKDKSNNVEFTFYNTHFDHRGQVARLESATLLRKTIEARAEKTPVIVTGDFNCGSDSKPYAQLIGSQRLFDSFRLANPQPKPNEGTFNGFKGTKSGARIDWIVHSGQFNPIAAAIDDRNRNGRYPSDHFPVTAILEWNPQ